METPANINEVEQKKFERIGYNYYPAFRFLGEGFELLKIYIVNSFLTIVSLGLYFPWARANYLKYYYNQTEFRGSRFHFSGTGNEMFRGWIKVYIFIVLIYGSHFFLDFLDYKDIAGYVLAGGYLVFALILPFAIHGFLRYRASRSSWRSIRFGYRGKQMELVKIYFKGIFLTLITLGIYFPWFQVELKKYTYENLRFGNTKLNYTGNGGDLFWIHFAGICLTVITCYIYLFWYQRNVFEYHTTHTRVIQDENSYNFMTPVTGIDFLALNLVNGLLIVFSLGIAIPWVTIRTLEFYYSNLWLQEGFDENMLEQTEDNYYNATGDEILDQGDLDLGFFDF